MINIKLKSVETTSQVTHPRYQPNTHNQGEQTLATEFDIEANQVNHQLLVLNKPFKIRWKKLNADIEAI